MAVLNEIEAQKAVHSIDQGKIAPIIRNGMFVALVIGLSLIYLFVQFRGFSTSTAMDQAQISRNLAAGKGFSTQIIRPLAIWQLQNTGKEIPKDLLPDFYQAPLNPLVNALPLSLVKSKWKMLPTDLTYTPERVIVCVSMLFFLLSVVVWYFVGKLLFDRRLSIVACAIILLTDMMWQFSMSGLPQMLMLFLFSGVVWLTLLAMRHRDRLPVVLGCLFGAGLLFGLMVLSHGLAVWMFLGWLLFALVYFQPRGVLALVAVAGILLVVLPWMARDYSVCGNPFGLSIYDGAASAEIAPEAGFLRSFDGPPGTSGMFRTEKVKAGVAGQVKMIFSLLGMNLAAGVFFLSLLHPFRSEVTSLFRWGALLMWMGAVYGMGIFGVGGVISSNQLHVLFLPVFIFYGLAFLLVLWGRLEFTSPILRPIFLGVVVVLCALPLISTLFSGQRLAVQWPPYVPPYIGILGDWFEEKEIIATDMPWAVAWYARRKALLLPETLKDFSQASDYGVLGEPVSGLYLTPITGNSALFSEIYKGAYKGWALLITRPPNVSGFQLPVYTALPIEGECIIFADRDRWTKRESGR